MKLAGDGLEWNTNPFLDDFGIYEGKKSLEAKRLYIAPDIKEVYIANHFRAILDLLFFYIKETGRASRVQYATGDWLDTPEQKELLLSKALLLQNAFEGKNKETLLRWIETERALEQ